MTGKNNTIKDEQNKTDLIVPNFKKSNNLNLMQVVANMLNPLDYLHGFTYKFIKIIENFERILDSILHLQKPLNNIFDLIRVLRIQLNGLRKWIKNFLNIE